MKTMKSWCLTVPAPVLLAAAVLCTPACSAPPLKTDVSASSLRAAEESGAAKVPLASLHMLLAKEETEEAQKLAKAGEKERAVSLLTRAEADAELALALAHEQNEKNEAAQAIDRVRALQIQNH